MTSGTCRAPKMPWLIEDEQSGVIYKWCKDRGLYFGRDKRGGVSMRGVPPSRFLSGMGELMSRYRDATRNPRALALSKTKLRPASMHRRRQ